MDSNNKIYSIIFAVLFVIFIISGATLAIYTWGSNDDDSNYIEGESTCFDIVYVKGNDIGSNENIEEISLGSDYTDGLSTTVKISIDSSCTNISGIGTLYLNTEEDTSDYLIDNNLLNYQVVVDDIEVASGTVDTKERIIIYDKFDINYIEKNITVYVWVNGETVTNDNVEEVLNSIYKGNITASAENR